MYELRPQNPPLPKMLALPQATVRQLASAYNPVRSETAAIAFDSQRAELEARVAFGNAARQWGPIDRDYLVRDYDFSKAKAWLDNFDPPAVICDAVSIELTEEEPFLHVILDTYDPPDYGKSLHDFPIFRKRFHYSDIDRPVGSGDSSIQLDGRVLEVGSMARRFSADRGLGRSQTTIRLANHDAALNELFRGTDFLRARLEIRVGFRSLPPRWYRRVGPLWRIDRVLAITSQYVELSLIDATDVLLGKMATPPTKQMAIWAVDPNTRGTAPGGGDTGYAPVPFGTEWVRAFIVRRRTYYPSSGQSKYQAQFCLGVSQNPSAVGPTVTGWDIANGRTDYPWRVGIQRNGAAQDKSIEIRLGRNHIPATLDLQISVSQVPIGPLADGRRWYAAILTLEYFVYQDVSKHAVSYVNDFVTAAEEGRLYVQWPWGAEGRSDGNAPWSGKHDPASIIELIVSKYMDTAQPDLLHKPSFQRARKNLAWEGMGDLGGFYDNENVDGAEVIGAIARTFDLDLVWGADGKVHVSTPAVGPGDLLSAVPGCPVYSAEWDIVRDSWRESIPLGADRWGLANRFKAQGSKDNTEFGWAATWPIFQGSEALERDWGRVLEADVEWAWRTTAQIRDDGRIVDFPAYLPVQRFAPRVIAEMEAPLFALELECGDFLRFAHFAGSQEDGGYDRRLFRVEEVALDWSTKRVKLVILDMDNEEQRKSAAFDNEARWVRFGRDAWDGLHRVTWPGGDGVTLLIGPLFSLSGIRVGDFIRIDELDLNARITAVLGSNTSAVTVDTDVPMPPGTSQTFRLERSHLDPPSDTGRYPLGSDHYFRSCDETTGLFSDASPGFRAEAG